MPAVANGPTTNRAVPPLSWAEPTRTPFTRSSTVPVGVTQQIVAPNNTVALVGRTLVESDSDLATAYGLAKQIQVTPLSQWHSGP